MEQFYKVIKFRFVLTLKPLKFVLVIKMKSNKIFQSSCILFEVAQEIYFKGKTVQ